MHVYICVSIFLSACGVSGPAQPVKGAVQAATFCRLVAGRQEPCRGDCPCALPPLSQPPLSAHCRAIGHGEWTHLISVTTFGLLIWPEEELCRWWCPVPNPHPSFSTTRVRAHCRAIGHRARKVVASADVELISSGWLLLGFQQASVRFNLAKNYIEGEVTSINLHHLHHLHISISWASRVSVMIILHWVSYLMLSNGWNAAFVFNPNKSLMKTYSQQITYHVVNVLLS